MARSKKFRGLQNWLIIHLGTLFFRMWFATCRIRIIGEDLHDTYITGPDKVVGATWHRNAIFLVWFFRHAHPMIMFSRSADGDLLAGFAEKLGIVPVRGSSSRGGKTALKTMAGYMARSGPQKTATVMDGPQGPRFVAKKGMIVLAKETGVPLLPIMASAWPAVTLKKAWDRTVIPLPFSRVTVSYREPWQVPADIGEEDMAALQTQVEATLNDMMREADTITGYIHQWPIVYDDN